MSSPRRCSEVRKASYGRPRRQSTTYHQCEAERFGYYPEPPRSSVWRKTLADSGSLVARNIHTNNLPCLLLLEKKSQTSVNVVSAARNGNIKGDWNRQQIIGVRVRNNERFYLQFWSLHSLGFVGRSHNGTRAWEWDWLTDWQTAVREAHYLNRLNCLVKRCERRCFPLVVIFDGFGWS